MSFSKVISACIWALLFKFYTGDLEFCRKGSWIGRANHKQVLKCFFIPIFPVHQIQQCNINVQTLHANINSH